MTSILRKTVILSLLILPFFNLELKATHMMGSDLTWRCIGKDSFMITLVIYRDCNGATLGAASIPIRCTATGQSVTSLSIARPTPVDITPTCGSSCTRCQTSGCAFPYGIEQYTYRGLAVLSNAGSCCKLTLSYTMCCRNSTITTGGADANFYIDAAMDRCATPCDNSPRFTNPPIAIICIGQDFIFNHGVIDDDVDSTGGLIDSLSYEWTQPMTGATGFTNWTGQYTFDKPIFFWGFPNANLPFPRGFHLDKQTGDMSFRPMRVEQTIMAIKIIEWRRINGVMTNIGYVRRDLQIIVITCPNNTAPILGGPFYKEVCATSNVGFTIQTNDYDMTDTLTISWNRAIPGASWTDNNGKVKHPTGNFSWTPGEQHASPIPYVFTVTVKDNACPVNGSSTRAYQILVKPLPRARITLVDSGCGDYHLYAQAILGSGPSFQWVGNFNPGFVNQGPYMRYKFNGPGKYPFSLQMDAQGCTRVYHDTIEVDTFITLQLTKDHSICFGDSTTLIAGYEHNSGHVKFKWHTGDTNQIVKFRGTQDTTYSVEISDTIGCVAEGKVVVSVHQLPKVDLGPDRYICSYGSTVLQPDIVFDRSVQDKIDWLNGKDNSLLLSGINSLNVNDSGTFICRVTDTLGCIGQDIQKVYKNPELIAYGPGLTICKGDPADLEANETGSRGVGVNYYWYQSSSGNLVGITRKIRLFPNETTDYKLVVKETIGGIECKDSTIIRVRVNPLPDIAWGTLPERCIDGAWINLNEYITTDPMNATKEWSSPSGGLLPIWPGDKFNPLIAGAGNHKVVIKATNAATGCVKKDSNIVIVNPLPTPNAGPDRQICTGDGTAALTGTPLTPAGRWYSVKGAGIEGTPGSYRFNPQAPGITDKETYPLVYEYTDIKGCVNRDTMNITVYQTPVVRAGTYPDVCIDGGLVNLSGTPVGGSWSGTGVQGDRFNPSVAGVGTHKIKYTYTNIICTVEDEVNITVRPLPVLTVSTQSGKTHFCNNNGYIELVGTPAGGTWTGPSGAIAFSTFFNTAVNQDVERDYELEYRYVDQYGCVNTKTITLRVRPAPEVAIDKTAPSLCYPATYKGNSTYKNASGVEWFLDPSYSTGNYSGSTTTPNVEYQPDTRDLDRLYFRLHIKTTHPDDICAAVYDSVRVEMSDLPEAKFSMDPSAGCNPHEVNFTDESVIRTGTITRWDWTFGDGNTSTQQHPVHKYMKPGTYTVKLLVRSNANCAHEIIDHATSHVVPQAGFVPDPELVLISSPNIEFLNTTSNETPGLKYEWNFGDYIYAPGGGRSVEKHPVYRYSDTGTYTIWLLAVNEFSCRDSISREIVVMPDVLVFVPSAFSPFDDRQGPSENDVFRAHVEGFSEFEIKVYSRWGELLYESDDYYTHGWKGLYLKSTEKCPMGVYAYVIRVKGLDGIDYKYSGTITLLW